MPEFIEFIVNSPERFQALRRVFLELKRDKDADEWRTTEMLLLFFDEESLRYFYWPASDERKRRLEDLRTRPVTETPTEQATGTKWDFDSMVDAFVNGEYELCDCEMYAPDKARLTFNALAYPYGGVGCMVALVESFGMTVTGIDDGTGFLKVS